MILIVGRKILLQQGDSEAFRIIMRDNKGKEVELSDTDIITLRMKYSMESNPPVEFKKEANIVRFPDGKIYHIFTFTSGETRHLPDGDYYYDVVLDNSNKRYTVVPKSILTLEKSISFEDIEEQESSGIELFDADANIDYESVIASNPLVGSFPNIDYRTSGGVIDEEIIIF